MIVAPLRLNKECDVDLRKESVSLPEVCLCLKCETTFDGLLAKSFKYLGKACSGLCIPFVPVGDTAVGRCDGSEWGRQHARTAKSESDIKLGSRSPGCLIQYMTGYWITLQSGSFRRQTVTIHDR